MAYHCLYIIGNGFDRFHDLPTSYHDFGEFVKSQKNSGVRTPFHNKSWGSFSRYAFLRLAMLE